MPIKWTPDIDQLLLLKILETHDIHLDTKKISAAWPLDKGDPPTARAITERLVKIRKDAKSSGSGTGHFGISSSQSKSAGKPRTPKKVNARFSSQEDDGDGDGEDGSPSKRVRVEREREREVTVKAESIEGGEGVVTPVRMTSSGQARTPMSHIPSRTTTPAHGTPTPRATVSGSRPPAPGFKTPTPLPSRSIGMGSHSVTPSSTSRLQKTSFVNLAQEEERPRGSVSGGSGFGGGGRSAFSFEDMEDEAV